jgi:hypothetical protein
VKTYSKGILDLDVVDAVVTHDDIGLVRLIINDDLEWDRPEWHLLKMQEKINAYLVFYETGQLLEYKGTQMPQNAKFSIEVYLEHPAPDLDVVNNFFERVTEIVNGAGLSFDVKLFKRVVDRMS